MSDKFSIDDILAEYGGNKKQAKPTQKPEHTPARTPEKKGEMGATMILNSLEKKEREKAVSGTKEISPEKIREIKPQIKDKNRPADTKTASSGAKTASASAHTAKSAASSDVQHRTVKSTASQTSVRPAEKPAYAAEENKSQITSYKNLLSSSKTDKVKIVIKDKMPLTEKIKQYRFLFEELTKRDFKRKYKRTFLGVLWSMLSPFLMFLIQSFVFTRFFGYDTPHFTIYLLTGTLVFHFFNDATTSGMFSMYGNAAVLSKIKVPKTIFVISSNVASVFNFFLTLIVYFAFLVIDGVTIGFHLLLMLYPIICLIAFNIGISYILSAMFVFFRDTQYLYTIFTQVIVYISAIFYTVDRFPEDVHFIFDINPLYRFISYIRQLTIEATVPDLTTHLVCFLYAAGALAVGYFIHKKTEQKFVYYF